MVTVTARDPEGLSSSVDVTIKVTDENEAPEIARGASEPQAPMFRTATVERSIQENTEAGSNIGSPVMATDLNGETLSYTLSGRDAATFDIEATTGQLKDQGPLELRVEDQLHGHSHGDGPGRTLRHYYRDHHHHRCRTRQVTGDALLDDYDPDGDDARY